MCLRKNGILVHNAGKSEVPHFGIVVCVKKNVSWLQISVQNLLGAIQILKLLFFASVDLSQVRTSVTIIQSRHDLGKDLPDEVLIYGVLLLNALADDLLQVPVLAVLHHDVDL